MTERNMPLMTINRKIFDLEYDFAPAEVAEFRVRVTMADTADAEAYGHNYGVVDPTAQPQLVGFLWLWFAARREGHIPDETTFDEFRKRCLDNARVGDDPVPPTRPGASDASLSTSPDISPASPMPSGSTPPGTTTG